VIPNHYLDALRYYTLPHSKVKIMCRSPVSVPNDTAKSRTKLTEALDRVNRAEHKMDLCGDSLAIIAAARMWRDQLPHTRTVYRVTVYQVNVGDVTTQYDREEQALGRVRELISGGDYIRVRKEEVPV
jgi:hypothetical protein